MNRAVAPEGGIDSIGSAFGAELAFLRMKHLHSAAAFCLGLAVR